MNGSIRPRSPPSPTRATSARRWRSLRCISFVTRHRDCDSPVASCITDMSKNRQPLSRLATIPLAALALLTIAPPLHAEGRTYTITSGAPNAVVFNIEDSVDPFDGKTANATGTITADPAAPAQAQVDVVIDLASLDTGVALRNQHMRERYLQTAKFPAVTF